MFLKIGAIRPKESKMRAMAYFSLRVRVWSKMVPGGGLPKLLPETENILVLRRLVTMMNTRGMALSGEIFDRDLYTDKKKSS